jgi:hypothetical protein
MNLEIPDVGDFYTAIGQSLVDVLHGDFQEAWVWFTVMDEAVTSIGVYYLAADGEYKFQYNNLNDLSKHFVRLYDVYKGYGNEWREATYHLTKSYKMDMHFNYDMAGFDEYLDIDDKRRDAWIRKYLGENVKIDFKSR